MLLGRLRPALGPQAPLALTESGTVAFAQHRISVPGAHSRHLLRVHLLSIRPSPFAMR
jgi:hypothetical protein